MKKTYKSLLGLGLFLTISTNSIAQVINESFANITTLAGAGWVMNNLSTPIGTAPNWFQGVNPPFAANSGAATEYIGVNYNSVAGANTISNWLIAPNRTFNNGDIITFFTRTVDVPAYADRLQVRLSLNGTSVNVGTTNVSVGDFTTLLLDVNPTLTLTGYPAVWTQYTITISGLGSPTSGRIAFRYFVTNGGPSGANSDYIGVDDFVYTPFGASAPDLTSSTTAEYSLIPLPQVAPIPVKATVSNIGTASTADAVLTAKIYQAPNFVTPIQSFTSTPATINNGNFSLITLGNFTPTAIGDYLIEYVSTCTNNTVTSADTADYFFSVVDNYYARDDGNVTASFGIGAGPVGYLGSMYTIVTATRMDSVLFALSKPGTSAVAGDGVGDSTRIVVYDVVSGLPNSIIGTTPKHVFTPSDTLGLTVYTLPVTAIAGGPLMLSPGVYFVSIVEYNTNVGLDFCDQFFNVNTVYASWTAQPFAPIESFGPSFAKTPVIRPYLYNCVPTSSSQTVSLCAGQSITVGTSVYNTTGIYTDIVTNANGCDSTITTNLTVASAIDVSTNVVGQTITANATSATYQWLDCDAGNSPIGGATNQSYTPTISGNYAVIVTVGSCSDTSLCVNLIVTGIKNTSSDLPIRIYPNPGNGNYTLELHENAQVAIFNSIGEVVLNEEMVKGNRLIDIQNQPNGIYLVKVSSTFNQQTIIITKE